ncbi:MAG: calcium/sodium antiporter [Gammaproteobacteria bacterium]|nr:calcium/sodium antiporter [Gammaproteobacteria bacterium]
MWFLSLMLLIGFLVLFKSADHFVTGAVATARNLEISPIIVGLTIVALGTSAPEIFVAFAASIEGKTEIAVGNAIGSNIANIGMVLGITALLIPLSFRRESLRLDLPIMLAATLMAGVVLWDYAVVFWDGFLLLAVLLFFFIRLLRYYKRKPVVLEVFYQEEEASTQRMTTAKSVLILGLSLTFLLFSAELLVWTVTEIARKMGVSELIIGLTVVAVGTSLPELVVSVTSALKGQNDLAIGNIIGSNIFNILIVLSIPAFISPTQFSVDLFWRDYLTMFIMTLTLVFAAYRPWCKARISRLEGGILFFMWCSYLVYLYYCSAQVT